MIAVLIPVGEWPFYQQALLRNIHETIGTDYHVYFLVSGPSQRLTDEFTNMSGKFSVHNGNIYPTTKGIHLELLDWAFRTIDLPEWVYVQHADMFWETKNWFRLFEKKMDHAKAIMPSYCATGYRYKHHKYQLDGRPLIRTHDFSGLYHRPTILQNSLRFLWTKVSHCNQQLVLDCLPKLEIIHESRPLKEDDMLDGSDLIGLFLGCQEHSLVAEVDEPLQYHHCWDLFGMGWTMSRDDDTIIINRTVEEAKVGIATYSWCSSFLYDYTKWSDRVIPWTALQQIMKPVRGAFADFIVKYKTKCTTLDNRLGGIRYIRFTDKEYSISKYAMML